MSRQAALALLLLIYPASGWTAAGREGAVFLQIPVGARPAALGAAYGPLATDAYATLWNPAGLGYLVGGQLSSMHLSYLEGVSYEYVGLGYPFGGGRGLGASIQYLGSGFSRATDATGQDAGEISAAYAAYSLGYGQSFLERYSAGASARLVTGRIGGATAKTVALDLGGMARLREGLVLSAAATNLGPGMRFVAQKDPLPSDLSLGAAYRLGLGEALGAAVGVLELRALSRSAHLGAEWTPIPLFALRAGFRTDALKELGGPAGWTMGFGFRLLGQQIDYAWLPYGELGGTHFFSLVISFNVPERSPSEPALPKPSEDGLGLDLPRQGSRVPEPGPPESPADAPGGGPYAPEPPLKGFEGL